VLRHQGKYEQAAEINQRVLTREKALGVDHPDTLISVNDLALALRYQGEYEQAEEMNRRGHWSNLRRRRAQVSQVDIGPHIYLWGFGTARKTKELKGNCVVKHCPTAKVFRWFQAVIHSAVRARSGICPPLAVFALLSSASV
jgi:hypothetical protein